MGVEEPHKALLVCVCVRVCVFEVKRSRICSVERKMVGRDTREMGDPVGESGQAHPLRVLSAFPYIWKKSVISGRPSMGRGLGPTSYPFSHYARPLPLLKFYQHNP